MKYTWEISETSVAFLDIKVPRKATEDRPVCTTNLQIPTVIFFTFIHRLIFPTSKTPPRSLNFLRLQRLCRDDSNFSNKSEEMRQFFYPDSVANAAQHRAQQIDRQSALQMSQEEKNERTGQVNRNNVEIDFLKILQTCFDGNVRHRQCNGCLQKC